MRPSTEVFGASSRRSSSRLAPTSVMNRVTPVTLWPGRLRLSTSPSFTGSPPIVNTTGIVDVATFGPAVIDRDVLTLDEASLGQPTMERGQNRNSLRGRTAA